MFCDLRLYLDPLDVTPKKIETTKFWKTDSELHQKVKLCASKNIIKKSEGKKERLTKWEAINANPTSTKGYICSIHKEPRQLNNKVTIALKKSETL